MPIIKINNININYLKAGKGKPLIFLHGIYHGFAAYMGLINILSKYYKVYAVDMPMHGKSDKPKKYISIHDISNILKTFINKFNIKNPIICAHSAGCLIAVDFASKNKTKELILTEPAGINKYDSKYSLFFKIVVVKILSLFTNPIRGLIVINNGLYNFLRNIFNPNYNALIKENLKKDYSKKIKKIKCPTKIFFAKHDFVIPYKNAVKFKNSIKNAKIIKVKGNHDWVMLKPKQIEKYLNN